MATHATNEVDHLGGIVRAKGLDYLGDDCRAGNDLRGFASEHGGVGGCLSQCSDLSYPYDAIYYFLLVLYSFTTFYWFLHATYCHFAGDEGPLTVEGAGVYVWTGVFRCPAIAIMVCTCGCFHGGMTLSVARPFPYAPPRT